MKRVYKRKVDWVLIAVIVSAALILTGILWRPKATGDANHDGRNNAVDLTMMKRHLVGTYDMDWIAIMRADLNGNGRIDEGDIIGVKYLILGDGR